jgi:uncharacterized protein
VQLFVNKLILYFSAYSLNEFKMTDFKCSAKIIVAMVHVDALPGTPKHGLPISQIVSKAVSEARLYAELGVDAILIENMHDLPYQNGKATPEVIACMTAVAIAIRNQTTLPLGIQILAAANVEAVAVALASGLNFIRGEGFVFGHVADEGYIDSNAARLMRYRRNVGAEHVHIFTDVKKKHSSHALTADVSLAETIHAAEFFLSDGLIVTGSATGCEASLADLGQAREATQLPLWVGSGVTAQNLSSYWNLADGFIVGSHFKVDGNWKNAVDPQRVSVFMNEVQRLRNSKCTSQP